MTTEPTTHTPGPWSWDEVPLSGIKPTLNDPHPTAWPLGSRNPDGTRGLPVLRHQAPWPVTAANARLIAAAPALLAELRFIAEQIEGDTTTFPHKDPIYGALHLAQQARAVIKAAQGG